MHNQLPVIHLVRHGDTAWTITGPPTGLTDLPLTPQGEEHAGGLKDRLKDIVFAKVLTSPPQPCADHMRAGRLQFRSGDRERPG